MSAGAAALAAQYGPSIYKLGESVIGQEGKAELRRQARRLINAGKRMMGIDNTVTKFRRRGKGARLPRYQKGFQRVTGFYGRFKPTFGKELKFFDTNVNDAGSNTNSWHIAEIGPTINLVGRGTGPNQRIGRNLVIRSLQFRYEVLKLSSIENAIYRFIVVLDKQANGTAPTGADIFVNGSTSSQTTWQQYRNLANISRFEILWDKTFALNSYSHDNALAVVAPHHETGTYFKKVNIPVEMSGTAEVATLADINDNAIHIFGCLKFPTTGAVHMHGTFRIRFTG